MENLVSTEIALLRLKMKTFLLVELLQRCEYTNLVLALAADLFTTLHINNEKYDSNANT